MRIIILLFGCLGTVKTPCELSVEISLVICAIFKTDFKRYYTVITLNNKSINKQTISRVRISMHKAGEKYLVRKTSYKLVINLDKT